MKKQTKKIIWIASALGVASIVAGVCAGTLVNQTSTTQTVSQASSQTVNSTQTATSNLTTASSKSTNEASAPSNNATTNTESTNLSNQTTTSNSVVKPIRNATIDTSILSATANITYTCPDGNVLVFSVNQNNPNTVTLLGFKTKKVSELVIPNVITTSSDFYAVTAIAPGAFYGQGITSVTFNHGLQTIGTLAFANNNLSSLTFPSNLQSIGDRAFISNQFPHAYAVYLPLNTTWNKNWLNCPFGNGNNLQKMINGIQWVIQGDACYSYEPNQNGWIITSYDIQNPSTVNTTWKTEKTTWGTTTIDTSTSQASYNMNYAKNINMPVAESVNQNLSDFCLYTKNQWGGIGWIFYFNPTNSTFNVFIRDNNGTKNYLFGNGVSTTLNISLYDPYSGQYLFNWNLNASSQSVPQTSFQYQPGDILTYTVNNSQSGSWAYVASNFNASDLTNNSFLNGSASSTLNEYIDLSFAWTVYNGLPTHFAIKPTGIYPTTSCTNLTNVSYDPTTGSLNLQGTSLPNMEFAVQYDGKNVGTFATNNDGVIDTSNNQLMITKNLTASDQFTIVALKSTNGSSDVIYPAPYTTHIQGQNPKLSLINLWVDGFSSSILFDGINGHLSMTNVSQWWPSFANPYFYDTQQSNPTGNFSGSGNINIEVKDATTGKTQNYPFSYTSSTKYAAFINYVNDIPYQVNDTYTLSGSNFPINCVWNNGEVVGYHYDGSGSSETASFQITNSGIVSVSTQHYDDSYLGSYNDSEWNGENSRNWAATYGWMACIPMDWECDSYRTSNWYDPSQALVKVVKQIVNAYTSPVNQVEAMYNFITNNMTYNGLNLSSGDWGTYYDHPINHAFNTMTGVCVEFSGLLAAMLKLAGFVSRQVVCDAGPGNLNGPVTVVNVGSKITYQNHVYTQVWMPTLQEWIALDPTFGNDNWDNYSTQFYGGGNVFGQLEGWINQERSDEAVNIVEWPEQGTGLYYDSYGTLSYHNYDYDNYFSYFKGCEYDALYNLGRHFNTAAGMLPNDYQYSFAQGIASILSEVANPSNSISSTNSYIMYEMQA